MTPEERLEKTVIKLEVVTDKLADIATDQEDRLRALEAHTNKGKGALYVIGSILTFGVGERLFQWLK